MTASLLSITFRLRREPCTAMLQGQPGPGRPMAMVLALPLIIRTL